MTPSARLHRRSHSTVVVESTAKHVTMAAGCGSAVEAKVVLVKDGSDRRPLRRCCTLDGQDDKEEVLGGCLPGPQRGRRPSSCDKSSVSSACSPGADPSLILPALGGKHSVDSRRASEASAATATSLTTVEATRRQSSDPDLSSLVRERSRTISKSSTASKERMEIQHHQRRVLTLTDATCPANPKKVAAGGSSSRRPPLAGAVGKASSRQTVEAMSYQQVEDGQPSGQTEEATTAAQSHHGTKSTGAHHQGSSHHLPSISTKHAAASFGKRHSDSDGMPEAGKGVNGKALGLRSISEREPPVRQLQGRPARQTE